MRIVKYSTSCSNPWFRFSWLSKFNPPTWSYLSKTNKIDLVLNSWRWTQWRIWLRQWKLREEINLKRIKRRRLKSKVCSNENWFCLITLTFRYDSWRRKTTWVNFTTVEMIWNYNWQTQWKHWYDEYSIRLKRKEHTSSIKL